MTDKSLAIFENYKIRRHYDEKAETVNTGNSTAEAKSGSNADDGAGNPQ